MLTYDSTAYSVTDKQPTMSFDAVMPPYNASDASATFLNSSCLDFLLIEIVPMAYRVANDLEAAAAETAPVRATGAARQGAAAPGTETSAAGAPSISATGAAGSVAATAGAGSIASGAAGTNRLLDEEEERDAVFFRLEGLGYRVGQGLVERFSKDRPRFGDTLDVIKFLCKDLWMLVFRKQVDNLKTNHRVGSRPSIRRIWL